MESLLLIRSMLVILSTCYTNGLTLNDLYPYGTENMDTMRTGSAIPFAQLQPPINNLVRFGPTGVTGTRYQVSHQGFLGILNDGADLLYLNLLFVFRGVYSNTKIYSRTTADLLLIKKAMDQINEAFPNTFCSTSPPTQLIITTWIDFLKTSSNSGSNFQAIIVTNGNSTFGIAFYVNVRVASATTGISSTINGDFVNVDPSFFPFGATVMDAPIMMSNSAIPGTYIFPLNDIPPDPCTDPDCSAVCKAKLLRMTCEAMKINGKDVPAPCQN